MALTGQACAASTAVGTVSGWQLARHSDGQDACHLEHLGADPGALGAADAEIGVNECFHGKFLSF